MKMNKNNIKIIVLTGGPCSGKSEGVKELKRILSDSDYKAITIPELATEMRQNGFICSEGTVSKIDFQRAIFEMQIFKENLYKNVMEKSGQEMILLLDRGLLDGKVYLSDDEFKEILDIHRLSEKDILDRYDAVFHMQSTSVGNAEFYDKSTNQYRFSSPEQARIQEHKTIETWGKHANFHFIPVEKDFKTKIQKLKALVFKELENKI